MLLTWKCYRNHYTLTLTFLQLFHRHMENPLLHELFTLKSIFDGMEDAVICHDIELTITNWNAAAERLFGYSSDEIIGQDIYRIIPETHFLEQEKIIATILSSKRITRFYTTRLSKAGEHIPVSLTVSPIRDDSGDIIGCSQIVDDVSKEIQAERQQAMLAAIIEGSDDAIVSKNLDGMITTWNRGAETMFGYKAREVIGRHISLLWPAEKVDEEKRIIETIKKGMKVDHYQTVRIHKDGSSLFVSLTVSPIRDKEGKIIGASKIARNITAQKEAERALENHARQLSMLNSIGKSINEKLDVSSTLQTVTDITTKLTGAAFGAFFYNKVNNEGESYLLYTLSGAPREAFSRFGMPRNTEVFHPTFSGQGVVRSDDITKDPRYGKMAPHFGMPKRHLPVVSYLAVPVVSQTGTVIGGLFFGHPDPGVFKAEHEALVVNVASQAALALDNAKLFEDVTALSRKKDEFIALASHELKTPLTSMSGFLQLLQKSEQGNRNRQFVDKALHQLEKLNMLVNDLFDVSKIQSGKLLLRLETFDLAVLLEDTVDSLKQSAPNHVILLEADNPLPVNGDKLRLEQVLINLVNNAIKYSPDSPKIEINAINKGEEIVVSVKDYGMGISKDNQAYIFDQFYRIRVQDHHIAGLGLGLYITKEIIDRHGGKIWIDSEPGKGATFSFSIPGVGKSIID